MKTRGNKRISCKRFQIILFVFFLMVTGMAGTKKAEAAYRIKGIDVSRWQGTINWKKVKDAGISYAMIGIGRCQNGNRQPDPKFHYNVKNAIANDIKVGIYLYSKATTVAQARVEAQFVLDQIQGYKISYPVAFDIEDTVHLRLSNKQRTDITIAFLSVIEEAGYYPMIYASENWLNQNMQLSRLTKYDKWVAKWSTSIRFRPLSMWQYSSKGRISGISGDVDLDYCYKDYSRLITPRTKAEATAYTKSGWKTDGTHHWYVQKDGKIVKNSVITVGGKQYYVNENGFRISGWKKIGGNYYWFLKKDGQKMYGWMNLGNGKKYYLDPKTGAAKKGWLTKNGKTYYFGSDYTLQKGLKVIGSKTYYFDLQTGAAVSGWKKNGTETYYFDKKTHQAKTGLQEIDSSVYYFDRYGKRYSGWIRIQKKWYYFGTATGKWQKNMKKS